MRACFCACFVRAFVRALVVLLSLYVRAFVRACLCAFVRALCVRVLCRFQDPAQLVHELAIMFVADRLALHVSPQVVAHQVARKRLGGVHPFG